MWYKKAEMVKDPETVSTQLAIAVSMIYLMDEKDANERMKKDHLVDVWLESTPRKLDYIV